MTNKQHLTRENVEVSRKRKPYKRSRISFNDCTKQRHKNQSYQSENR